MRTNAINIWPTTADAHKRLPLPLFLSWIQAGITLPVWLGGLLLRCFVLFRLVHSRLRVLGLFYFFVRARRLSHSLILVRCFRLGLGGHFLRLGRHFRDCLTRGFCSGFFRIGRRVLGCLGRGCRRLGIVAAYQVVSPSHRKRHGHCRHIFTRKAWHAGTLPLPALVLPALALLLRLLG